MFKKIFLSIIAIGIAAAVLFFAIDGSANKEQAYKTIPAERGLIIDKALAVGRIEPKQEISVKSKISGIVRKIYVEIGDEVQVGDPLLEIAPDPTPIELTSAKRDVEIKQVTYDNAKRELDRFKSLKDKDLISHQDYDRQESICEESRLRLQLSKEKLSLIESGKTSQSSKNIENVIKSPISGTVLSRHVEEGDPIVPLTSYQAGTDLLTLAKMDDLIFKGNVDEIDVGKLTTDMEVEIEIGALSEAEKLKGVLTRISPKAHREEGSTMFEVEIVIEQSENSFLRAGYSANADIIITKKENIILIPERLITTRDSIQYVEIQDSLNVISEREITTGLSDGIKIEILEGVEEGELLVERPPKEIEVWD